MLSLLETCLHFLCRPHQHPLLPRPASPLPLASLCNDRPQRADLVGTVAETSSTFVLDGLRRRMQADPEGRVVLAEQPRVTVRRCGKVWT